MTRKNLLFTYLKTISCTSLLAASSVWSLLFSSAIDSHRRFISQTIKAVPAMRLRLTSPVFKKRGLSRGIILYLRKNSNDIAADTTISFLLCRLQACLGHFHQNFGFRFNLY